MGKIGRTTGIILCAALLALTLGTSAALAYFSDYEPAEGKVTFSYSGERVITEGDNPKEKNIQIKNTGAETDADVVVRVGIYGPKGFTHIECDETVWSDGGDGWYYYKGILAPGEETPKDSLVVKIQKDGKDLTDKEVAALGDSFQIAVVQEDAIATYEQDASGKNVLVNPDGWKLPVGEIPVE